MVKMCVIVDMVPFFFFFEETQRFWKESPASILYNGERESCKCKLLSQESLQSRGL